MPGLLDFFSPDDPNKQQGLLAAAAAMLQASGPSRMPTSFGQVLGQGLGGYQQGYQGAQNRDLQMEAAKQEAQLRGLKIQDAESDVANQQKMRERQNRIAQRLMGAQGPAASPDAQQAPMASAMPGAGPMPAAQPAPAAPRANQTDAYVERLLSTAHVYASEGDIDTANKLYEQAAKLRPKYSTDFRTAMGADGKMHNYQLADDGTQRDTGLGVAPNVTEVDLGGSKQFVDKNSVTPGQIFNKTATPGEMMSSRQAAARLQFDKSQAAAGPEALLPDNTVQMMAQQYLAGDTSVMQNLGRGAQGAQNIIKLRNEVTRQAQAGGMGGADMAAKNAEYFGTKAGQRTAGTRIANVEMASNEAQSLIPLARQASSEVQRSGLLPFGKGQIMFDQQTNDPALRKFAAANNALINVYSRAISPSGTPTVADKEHAREMLNTAMDQRSYNAVLDQMQQEITAARQAPKAVRQAFNAEVTGKDAHTAAPAPAASQKFDMLPAATGFAGKRMRADNGTVYRSDGTKWNKE